MTEYFYNVYERTCDTFDHKAGAQFAGMPHSSRGCAEAGRQVMEEFTLYRPVCMVHVTRCISTEAGLAKDFAEYAEKVRREAEEGYG